ncbi:aspartate/glutamate racemase family protein [Maribacter sp. 2307UL18-2]|uniref:aspartate/glutamate racemase family protein n=1 Tax=Maribacter sp. 2307UL18-2 TaxID=3386274 RepID=UPI0039BD13C7
MSYKSFDINVDKVIGIVGGMGPEAGVDLVSSIYKNTQAFLDQDHLSVILMSFPKYLEDRTAFIMKKKSINPALNIVKIILKLERAGATLIGIACNSSYSPSIHEVILAELKKKNSKVKLLNMPYETCQYIKKEHPDLSRIGVISTNGTYHSGVYHNILRNLNFEVIIPDYNFQHNIINQVIYNSDYGIKANSSSVISKKVEEQLQKILNYFEYKKVDAVILGCTELALIPENYYHTDILLFNSNELFAKALIKEIEKN